MRRLLYLARHGETEWNRLGRWQGQTDIVLSDVGRAQARVMAERLRGVGLSRIAASHLARARETAEIAAGVLGLGPVEPDPDLCERAFGCFEGLTREECAVRFPEAWARYHADARICPPGGEAQEAVVARMRAAVGRAAATLGDGEATLLVTHGGAMRAFIASVTGTAPPPVENGAVFRVVALADGYGEIERMV